MQLLAKELFARLEALPAGTSFTVQLSMIEIYNERCDNLPRHAGCRDVAHSDALGGRLVRRVRDLLAPRVKQQGEVLRIRESPVRGPYLEGIVVKPLTGAPTPGPRGTPD